MKTYNSMFKKYCKALPALLLGVALMFSTGAPASGQILNDITRRAKNAAETKIKMGADRAVHKTLDKAEKAVEKGVKNAADNATAKTSKASSSAVPEGRSAASTSSGKGGQWYVSAAGSNQNDGLSPETPLKNVQKALDEASDGDVINVAEGNYTGTLDQGYIDIKKYVCLVGGYSSDFSERDPYVYKTYIQTNPSHVSKNGTKAGINIEVSGSRAKTVMVDGFSVDMGEQVLYCGTGSDPVYGYPEGCLTGRKIMVGESPAGTKIGGSADSRQCVHGYVEGHLVIRNCVFANSCYFGIQMMSKGGKWEIYNNIFVANNYASCQVDSMTKDANECYVDFHNNTVLFSWCRDKEMGDMGLGYRIMSRVDSDIHDNIFGCSNLGAIEYTHHDSNKQIDALRKVNINDNQFFMNVGDLIIPSQSYMWLHVSCDEFEDVEGFTSQSGNVEMTDANFTRRISQPYLRGFANIEKVSSSSYNPNSAANQVRRAFGINQQGSETIRVSMFANKYPFFEAYDLFGALEGCGAQIL